MIYVEDLVKAERLLRRADKLVSDVGAEYDHRHGQATGDERIVSDLLLMACASLTEVSEAVAYAKRRLQTEDPDKVVA